MSKIMNARLKEWRETKGLTQAALGERLGLQWYQVKDMESGKVKITLKIEKLLYAHTDIRVPWFKTGEGPMCREPHSQSQGQAQRGEPDAAKDSMPPYGGEHLGRVVDVYVLAGAGTPKDLVEHDPIDSITIPEDFYSPSMVPVKIRGRSMEPVIRDGAYIGVDRSDRQVVSGEVYAIWMPHEGAVVKRLFMELDKVIIRSDNKDFPTFTIPYRDLEAGAYGDDFILGRVRWVIQRL